MCERDYTNNFTTDHNFLTSDDLIRWIEGIAFHLGVIMRSNKGIGQPSTKTLVLLGCETGGK